MYLLHRKRKLPGSKIEREIYKSRRCLADAAISSRCKVDVASEPHNVIRARLYPEKCMLSALRPLDVNQCAPSVLSLIDRTSPCATVGRRVRTSVHAGACHRSPPQISGGDLSLLSDLRVFAVVPSRDGQGVQLDNDSEQLKSLLQKCVKKGRASAQGQRS